MSLTETECPCCVICLVEIEDNSICSKSHSDNSNKKLCRKFLKFVKCRLKVAEFSYSCPALCERCSEVASNLCDLYKELQLMETRMFLKLEEMEAILSMERETDATKLNKRGRAEVDRFREILTRQVRWYFDVERSTKSKEDDVDSDSGPDSEIKDEPEEPSPMVATDEPENEDYEDDDGANSESDTNMDDNSSFIVEDEDISSDSFSLDEFEDSEDDYEQEIKHEFDFKEEEDPLKIEIEVQSHTDEEPQHQYQQATVKNQSQGKRSRKSAVIPRQEFGEFSLLEIEVIEVPPVPSTSSSNNQHQSMFQPRTPPPQTKRPKLGDPWINEETEKDWSFRPCGICKVTKTSFASANDLRMHMREHEVLASRSKMGKPSFHCPFCPRVYYYEDTMKVHIETLRHRHVRMNFPDLRFRCDGENGENDCCTETYGTFADLGHHLKTRHPGATVYYCDKCKWPFLNKSARDLHQLIHINRIKKGPRKTDYKCPIPSCPVFCTSISSIVSHFSIAHGTGLRPYRCPQCPYRGYTIHHVNHHLDHVHQTTTLNDKPVEFLCDICSVKSFKTLRKLKTHKKKCCKTGICDICGQKLLNSKELENHKLEVHQVEPPRFVCDQCGKVLLSEAGRILHLRHHENRHRERLCPHCGKVFHHRINMHQHMKIHVKETTGEERKRDSVCQDCGKAYFDAGDLNKHRVMNHLSEEEKQKRRDRYRCPLCQKGFLIAEYLKGHIRTVHKVDPNETLNTSKGKQYNGLDLTK